MSLLDSYAKPWLIPLNDKKNMIELMKRVNKPCIDKNLFKAIQNNGSFHIQDIEENCTIIKKTWPLALARCLGGHGHEHLLTN